MSQKSGYSDLGDWDYQRRQSAWAGLVLSIGCGTQRRKHFNNKEQYDYVSDAKPFCWAVQISGVTGQERRWRVIPGCHRAFAPAVAVWGTFLLSTSHFSCKAKFVCQTLKSKLLKTVSPLMQCGTPGFNPWVGKIPWRRKWQPIPVFLPGESHGLSSPWNSPGQNTGMGSLSLLQGIFPTQGSNSGLLHCRQIFYQLSYQGSPCIS